MDLETNNKNEARQGPAFRALARGLSGTSRREFLPFQSILSLLLTDTNDRPSAKSK